MWTNRNINHVATAQLKLNNLNARGQNLPYSVVVQQQILLYLLPDGSSVNRPGWVLSLSVLWAQFDHCLC